MSDPIERADAIKAINCWLECNSLPQVGEGILYGIPSAGRPSAVDLSSVYSTAYKSGYEKGKADRPQGEWIKDNLGTVICSECKRPRRDNRVGHTNFCNSCGARMKGAGDETD